MVRIRRFRLRALRFGGTSRGYGETSPLRGLGRSVLVDLALVT